MLSTSPKPLVLPDRDGVAAPKLRYYPLPALAVVDYIEDYGKHLGQTGVFDYLSLNASGIDAEAVKRVDLSAVGVLGNAAMRVLSGDGGVAPRRLSEMVVDHCKRFRVQAWDAEREDWVALTTTETINAWLTLGHFIDLVRALGGEALRPLWSRLSSRAEERPSGSATPSPETLPES